MLKSFINYKTWEKVRLTKWEFDKAKLEEQLGMEVKWDVPFSDSPEAKETKKRGRPKKDLDANTEE